MNKKETEREREREEERHFSRMSVYRLIQKTNESRQLMVLSNSLYRKVDDRL